MKNFKLIRPETLLVPLMVKSSSHLINKGSIVVQGTDPTTTEELGEGPFCNRGTPNSKRNEKDLACQ